jgi:hypothetical protein
VFRYTAVYTHWECLVGRQISTHHGSTLAARGFVALLLRGALQLHVWEESAAGWAPSRGAEVGSEKKRAMLGVSAPACPAAHNIVRHIDNVPVTWGPPPPLLG